MPIGEGDIFLLPIGAIYSFFQILSVMRYTRMLLFFLLVISMQFAHAKTSDPIVLGYFPSWSESWASTDQNSKLREVPSFVNHIFLSFAKPNLTYTLGSYDISDSGIQTPYDGCTLKESVSALKDKGIKVILSIGGETYWGSQDAYNINYQQIKDLVDDMGFAGIDWDYEPNGSFLEIGNAINVQHYIDFFTNSRAIMPRSEGYILACAPSGVGALGGVTNDDIDSPFAFSKRNDLTGETDANLYLGSAVTNGINLFGYSSTGHMIPVIKSVGDKIDIIAYQAYNAGGSVNRSIMYDSFAYYAEQYGFQLAAGVHYPDEPWGPYYTYVHENIASLSKHIRDFPDRIGDNDGVMIWQMLLENQTLNSSAYSYLNVASLVLNGSSEMLALQDANDFILDPYTGGAETCNSSGGDLFCGVVAYNSESAYPTAGTQVYYQCKIWHNQWYANMNEVPGVNSVWVLDRHCDEDENCDLTSINDYSTTELMIYPVPSSDYIRLARLQQTEEVRIYNYLGMEVLKVTISDGDKIDIRDLNNGIYFLSCYNGKILKFIKE